MSQKKNDLLDNTLRLDGVIIESKEVNEQPDPSTQTRYSIRTSQKNDSGGFKYEFPDPPQLFDLTRAWNIKNQLEDNYHQPCTYMLSALLIETGSPDLAYQIMQKIWHNLGHKLHFADDFEHSNAFMRSLQGQIQLILPAVADKLNSLGLFEQCIQSFYCIVVYNFGFTGQECGLSMEVALRLFEFFIFNQDVENVALTTLFIYILQLSEQEILELESDECFRFIG